MSDSFGAAIDRLERGVAELDKTVAVHRERLDQQGREQTRHGETLDALRKRVHDLSDVSTRLAESAHVRTEAAKLLQDRMAAIEAEVREMKPWLVQIRNLLVYGGTVIAILLGLADNATVKGWLAEAKGAVLEASMGDAP